MNLLSRAAHRLATWTKGPCGGRERDQQLGHKLKNIATLSRANSSEKWNPTQIQINGSAISMNHAVIVSVEFGTILGIPEFNVRNTSCKLSKAAKICWFYRKCTNLWNSYKSTPCFSKDVYCKCRTNESQELTPEVHQNWHLIVKSAGKGSVGGVWVFGIQTQAFNSSS